MHKTFSTTRARLAGATVPSPKTTPGIRVLSRITDLPVSTLKPALAGHPAAGPGPRRSRNVPPRHPEPHAHSLCAPDPAEVGEGAAVLPLPGAPGRLCFLGSDRRRPGRDCLSPQTNRSKAKVPPGRKGTARRPASFRSRQSPGCCRSRPIGSGCSERAPPPPRGHCSANPMGLSLEFAGGLPSGGGEAQLCVASCGLCLHMF